MCLTLRIVVLMGESVGKTGVQFFLYQGFVQVLTYEYQLLHAVSVFAVPVGGKNGVLEQHFIQLAFGHGSEPLA